MKEKLTTAELGEAIRDGIDAEKENRTFEANPFDEAPEEFPVVDLNQDYEDEARARVEDAEQFDSLDSLSTEGREFTGSDEYEPKFPTAAEFQEKLTERNNAYAEAADVFDAYEKATGEPAVVIATPKTAGSKARSGRGARMARERRDFFAARPDREPANAEVSKELAEKDEEKVARGEMIREETMVLFFKLRKPSFKTRMREDEVSVRSRAVLNREASEGDDDDQDLKDAEAALELPPVDYAQLNLSKSLLPREALRPIRALDAEWKRQMRAMAVPVKVIGNGKFVLPLCFVEQADTAILNFIDMRRDLIEDFLDNYDSFIREGLELLGELGDRSNYPSREDVRRRFGVEYAWKSFNVPRALKGVKIEMMRREMNRAKIEWSSAADEIRDGLRAGLYDLVTESIDKFGAKGEGERISFSQTFIAKVNRFLETFDGRDLADDAEVRTMVNQLKNVMEGVTDKDIKKNADIRQKVADAFKSVKTEMDAAEMVEEGRRLRKRSEAAPPDGVSAA